MRAFTAAWLLVVLLGSCRPEPAGETESAGQAGQPGNEAEPGAGSVTSSSTPPAAAPIPTFSAEKNTASAPRLGASPACSEDMALVEGSYCPLVQQICLERPQIPGAKGNKQCQRYGPPKCMSKKRQPLRFCMDRYEWPNQKGVKPRTLTSWPEAKKMCGAVGKRLCTMREWEFACEGEDMKAHVYGNVRSPDKCNFDRPYRERTFNYYPWSRCMADEACKHEYERLDQRLASGSMPGCVSDHGIYDLNGNANEWVVRTDQLSPRRSGLKGGWWGPVRNRCRPMTTFHLEGDYGYEVGFRCCTDAS